MLKWCSIAMILRQMGSKTIFGAPAVEGGRAAVSSGRAVAGGRCAQRAHVWRRERRAARWAVRGALPRARVGGRGCGAGVRVSDRYMVSNVTRRDRYANVTLMLHQCYLAPEARRKF